jgi:hypothetical protein
MERLAIGLCLALIVAPAEAQQPPHIDVEARASASVGGACEIYFSAANLTDLTMSISGRMDAVRNHWNDVHYFSLDYIRPGQRKNTVVSFDGNCTTWGKPERIILYDVTCQSSGKIVPKCGAMLWDKGTPKDGAIRITLGE